MPIAANIYYHVYDRSDTEDKPPLVLIHGAGGTRLYWPPEIRRLPGYRVLALDLPGHGKSPGRGQQSIKNYASGIIDWMNGVKLSRAVFIGHSMGAAIAINLALDHPEQVSGLALIGAGARLKVNPQLLEDTTSQTTFNKAVHTLVSWSFSQGTPARLKELAAERMLETRLSVLHGDLLACDSFDTLDHVSEIQQPTLIVCGDEDKMTPPRLSKYLEREIRNSRLKFVPGAGHMVMLEQPQITAELLVQFLGGFPH